MNGKCILGNLIITPVVGWCDVTSEIEASNAPLTLARTDGVGVLQFSAAAYRSGSRPEIRLDDLRALLSDFALSRELGKGFDEKTVPQPLLTCAQSFNAGEQFLRVWYCSNGRDVVLVTYVSAKAAGKRDLAECEQMVAGLEFKK